MPKRADSFIALTLVSNPGCGTAYTVQTPTGDLYWFFIDSGSDLAYRKSVDGGLSWSISTIIFTGSVISYSIWYDRWSDISAGLIHLAYTESGGHDTLYRTLDTESSDALSTQTTIFAGASVSVNGSFLSICRARGGNVYCRTQIDNGTEGGFFRLPNANVPNGAWDAARTINEAAATLDMMILLPGWAADNQDMIAIFWDASANEISRQVYDDSANSWAETLISASMTDITGVTGFPNFSACVDIANSRHILIAWSNTDVLNSDLLCWTITESAITAKADVITNSTDDQALCGITIDPITGYWFAVYGGKSDGSETWSTAINLYYKVSKDQGTTWGDETRLTTQTFSGNALAVPAILLRGSEPIAIYVLIGPGSLRDWRANVPVGYPSANYQLGI